LALDAESAEVLGNIKALLMKKVWQTKPLGDLCDVLDHKHKPIRKIRVIREICGSTTALPKPR
jgi:hypothetical protein